MGGGSSVFITNDWATSGDNLQLNVCNWAAPKYGDEGQSALHGILSVIAYAVAIWSAKEQMKIAHERYEIAKSYADMAWDKWARFRDAYAPLEAAMIAEIMAEPEVKPDYDEAKAAYGRFAEFSFAAARKEAGRLARRYCLCLEAPDFETDAALALDDGVNFGYRSEEYRAITRDDVRWNRRSGLLNLGRHLLSMSASYAATADGALAGAGQAAGQAMSGALNYIGYNQTRMNTYYPSYPQDQLHSPNPGGLIGLSGASGVAESGPGITGSMAVDRM